jgi:hypothetical protein
VDIEPRSGAVTPKTFRLQIPLVKTGRAISRIRLSDKGVEVANGTFQSLKQ